MLRTLTGSLILLAVAGTQASDWPISIDLESGLVAQRYNNARVPNASGTTVSLGDLLGRGWNGYVRVQAIAGKEGGPQFRLLYAPLERSGRSSLPGATSFDGQNFAGGPVDAAYRFSSYRLTYRNGWKGGWVIGFTAKVRDAKIELKQGNTFARESDLGFVPLLHLYRRDSLGNGWGTEFEFDGLAGGPGRAFDTSLRLRRDIGRGSEAFIGVRVLEGGADVPRVYNSAWLTYITAGVRVPLGK